GLFAGLSLEGSSLRQDKDSNEVIYGRPLSAKRILREGKVPVPKDAQELVSFLNRHSPKNLSQ
ncbi:MAG TPA: YSC84-related protein, partial [Candidatus Acidoferrales bacterium]|nr:YSC84-related protein [Candidatus Acidoferrales bacterium]